MRKRETATRRLRVFTTRSRQCLKPQDVAVQEVDPFEKARIIKKQ
jgi:hypothetical protein